MEKAEFSNEKRLMPEESFEFKDGERRGLWVSFSEGLEGEYFECPDSNKVVLFVPGLPGDSVEWMKKDHLDSIMANGSGIMILRHNGLRVEKGSPYVSNAVREDKGGIIGKSQIKVADWIKEPRLALEYLSGKDVTIISHSFGSLATAMTLMHKLGQPVVEGVGKWINLSGVTDSFDSFKNKKDQWEWYLANVLAPLYDFDNKETVTSDLEGVYRDFSGMLESGASVGDTRLISVYPEQDKVVDVSSGENLHSVLREGLLIHDHTVNEEEYPDILSKNPFAVHDYPHLKTETLLRLINMKVSKVPHTVTFNKN